MLGYIKGFLFNIRILVSAYPRYWRGGFSLSEAVFGMTKLVLSTDSILSLHVCVKLSQNVNDTQRSCQLFIFVPCSWEVGLLSFS